MKDYSIIDFRKYNQQATRTVTIPLKKIHFCYIRKIFRAYMEGKCNANEYF